MQASRFRFLAVFAAFAVAALQSTAEGQTHRSCLTPARQPGECVPFKDCNALKNVYRTYGRQLPDPVKRFIQDSICVADSPEIHLCCANEKVETRVEQKTTLRVAKDTSSADYNTFNQRGLDILNRLEKCGNRANEKVSGGEATKLAEFPWMALLRYDNPNQPYQCGGSIITERYVLTAAHCIVSVRDKLIGVRLGEYNVSSEQDCQWKGRRRDCLPPAEDFGIAHYTSHPEYKHGQINHDIAVIKVDRDIVFKRHIKPVCLPITPKSKDIAWDQRYYIAGWGLTEKDRTSNILLKAIVERKSLDHCRTIFRQATITENHICASGEGIIDTCRGDSGGPLFFLVPFKNTPRFVQYGIVSFGGAKCGDDRGYPGVYANVLDMLPWITHNID